MNLNEFFNIVSCLLKFQNSKFFYLYTNCKNLDLVNNIINKFKNRCNQLNKYYESRELEIVSYKDVLKFLENSLKLMVFKNIIKACEFLRDSDYNSFYDLSKLNNEYYADLESLINYYNKQSIDIDDSVKDKFDGYIAQAEIFFLGVVIEPPD